MKKENLYDILISPINTEKATNVSAFSKYMFRVHQKAHKKSVKNAVEKIFGVKVLKVNILNTVPQKRVFKGVRGVIGAFKKAIVTLESGAVIDFIKI